MYIQTSRYFTEAQLGCAGVRSEDLYMRLAAVGLSNELGLFLSGNLYWQLSGYDTI